MTMRRDKGNLRERRERWSERPGAVSCLNRMRPEGARAAAFMALYRLKREQGDVSGEIRLHRWKPSSKTVQYVGMVCAEWKLDE